MRRSVTWFLLAVAACDDGSSDERESTSEASSSAGLDESSSSGAVGDGEIGFAVLTFGVANGVRQNPTLVDPLVGSVYGDIYRTADVTLTGPAEGAVPVASVQLDAVDLTTLEVSDVSWGSGPLEPDQYTFLGMFDIDGNFAETGENPDAGDPVTLPTQKFEVTAAATTAFTVMFELVYS